MTIVEKIRDTIKPLVKRRDAAVIGFGLTLALLLLGGILGYQNAWSLAEQNELVSHTQGVILKLESLLSTVKDGETGQRGFMLTEDPKYLAPYNSAVKNIDNELDGVRQKISDNPGQQKRLEELRQVIKDRLEVARVTIEEFQKGNRDGAVNIVKSDQGKKLMDEARKIIDGMQSVEQNLMNSRSAEARKTFRSLVRSITFTTILGIVLVSIVFLMSQRNIRQREKAAAVIAEQKERLRTTLASIGDAVISTDTEARITNMNAIAEVLTGWSNEEALGLPLETVFRIVNEDTRLTVPHPAEKALREGIVVGLANHTVLIAKDGRERAIDDSAAPIRCKEGEVVGCVLIFRDITEQRQAMKETEASEARKTSILETALDCIISCDHEGRIVDFNPAAERTFGYRREEVVGREMSDIVVPVSLRQRHQQGMTRYMQTRESRILGKLMVMTGLRSDGREFPVEFSVNEVKTGGLPMFTAYLRDITDRKRMEDDLRQTASDLSEANRRKNEFLAMLAHELRNPLAPIRNALQVLKLTGGDPTTVSTATEMMERQVGQMVRFVDDLLDVSRISRGKIELRQERMDLASAVNHAVEAALPLYSSLGNELTVTLPPESINLLADPARIIQVVGNLLNNACKFTPRGGKVRLTVEKEGNEAVIRVRDTGIGIAAEQLPHIFEMFMQIDTSLERSVSGLGIGLTLVKNLVEMHGGAVQVFSEGLGRGSEFVVHLPTVDKAAESEPGGVEGDLPTITPRRVLVVDDNRDAATSLVMLLKLMGHEAHGVYDGVEALAAAEELRPEVILCDLGLPKLNGYEVARRVRDEEWGKGIRLVALTGWGQAEDRKRSNDAGFNGHLVKPVAQGALTRLLAEPASGGGTAQEPMESTNEPETPSALKILIVDDRRDAIHMLSTLLQAAGHDVVSAADGLTGLESAKQYRPDVVLSDISLPGMSGLDLARAIREEADLEGIVLVAMTGYGEEEDRQRSKEAGFDHHLVKPADIRVIHEILSGVRRGG